MKVEGADILSDVTEKTSRNLKATAAIVIAVKLFQVPVEELVILSVKLPPNLFDVTSFFLISYLASTTCYGVTAFLLARVNSLNVLASFKNN
jgi:hypothetical protein